MPRASNLHYLLASSIFHMRPQVRYGLFCKAVSSDDIVLISLKTSEERAFLFVGCTEYDENIHQEARDATSRTSHWPMACLIIAFQSWRLAA